MLRRIVAQSVVATRFASRPVSVGLGRPALYAVMRYSTDSKTEADRKAYQAAMDAKHELQRDWDAKELSYEELKPKVLQPRPVDMQ